MVLEEAGGIPQKGSIRNERQRLWGTLCFRDRTVEPN